MRRTRKRLDWFLIAVVAILVVTGSAAVFSASEITGAAIFRKHLTWLVVGTFGAGVFGLVNPEFWLKSSRWLYVISAVLLLLVLRSGEEAGGAQRWISVGTFQFQPSELSKLLLIVTLTNFLVPRLKQIKRPSVFVLSFAHVGVLALLVFKQPDLGTALVLIGIWVGMVVVAGAEWRHLAAWLIVIVLLFAGAWETGVLHDYQKRRVTAFLDPKVDPQGAGYQLNQARMAIGSGGVTGEGIGHGEQKEGRWVPAQHTDFIFTVIAEEDGFVGSVLLAGVYGFLLYRIWRVMADTGSDAYRLLAAGVFALWSYHVMVNLAMVLGLFPVVGVPLPLVSYGGTSTIVSLCSIGLILGIRARGEKIVF